MKKVTLVLALAMVCCFALSSTASAGLFCWKKCCCEKILVDCEYTVKVPIYEDKECVRKVWEWVKCTKTVDVCVDRGCWEDDEVTVPVRKHRCFFKKRCGCDCGCCFKTVTCKRWVPNIVTESKDITCCKRVIVEKSYTRKVLVGWGKDIRHGKKWICAPCCHSAPCCDPCAPCAQ